MGHTEIKLHILYFLVAVIVTCETRFRHHGQTYNTGRGYGDRPILNDSQRENIYSERYPKNIPLNGAPFSGGYLPGRYTNQIPVNTGRLVSNRGRQAEISPYSSKQVPPGRYLSTYPSGFTQTANNDGGSVLYDKSLIFNPGMGYANPTMIPKKVLIDPRLYDGSQVVHPYDDQNPIVYNRTPYYNKFKKPSSGQTKANKPPAPYGRNSRWSINRHAANKEESLAYNGYPGVRSFRNIPTVNERGDLVAYDNFPQYDSIPNGDPTNYLIVKNRILADYNFL